MTDDETRPVEFSGSFLSTQACVEYAEDEPETYSRITVIQTSVLQLDVANARHMLGMLAALAGNDATPADSRVMLEASRVALENGLLEYERRAALDKRAKKKGPKG